MKLNSLLSNQGLLAVAIAAGAYLITSNFLKGHVDQAKANAALTVYDATVATTSSNIDDLKNNVLKYLYSGALNPANVIDNIEAIKSELNNYTQKLTDLATQVASGIVPQSTVNYYLQTIAQQIATKLNIEIRPSNAGNYGGGYGYGGYGNGGYNNVDYQNYLQQYLQYLQQMQQLYQGQYGYPSYGYSYGYGYQQPNMQPQYPTQYYNYYPSSMSPTYPYGYNTYSPYQQQQSSYYYNPYQQQQQYPYGQQPIGGYMDTSMGGSIYNNYY